MRGRKIALLFSHRLTDDQSKDLKENHNVGKVLYLPSDLQDIWSNIPPELSNIEDLLCKHKKWLLKNLEKGDYVLIQGDFGASYIMIEYSKKNKYIPIYSTSKRIVAERDIGIGEIEKYNVFKHVRFRKY